MRHHDRDFDDLDDLDFVGSRKIHELIEQNRRADRQRGRIRHASRVSDDPWNDFEWTSYDDYDDNDYPDYDPDEFDSYAGVTG